jgi:hypothetical protein
VQHVRTYMAYVRGAVGAIGVESKTQTKPDSGEREEELQARHLSPAADRHAIHTLLHGKRA